jgi:hypothetical protein
MMMMMMVVVVVVMMVMAVVTAMSCFGRRLLSWRVLLGCSLR